MTTVLFHLFDFEVPGTPYSSGRMRYGPEVDGHLELNSKVWNLTFRQVYPQSADSGYVYPTGRYRLSTVGELKKSSEEEFVGEEAEDILDACRYLLSFARGKICVPSCPVGRNSANEAVWSLWTAPGESGPVMFNLFDGYETEELGVLFPGFMKKWNSEGWRDAMMNSIRWYVSANHSFQNVDAGLVFSQVAMETLSYQHCVSDERLLSAQGFGALKAADQYRMLLSSLSIPLGIPSLAVALSAEAKGRNWVDGPEALTEIRNKLIHGGPRKANLSDDCYVDAWKLGMWFLEMVLLKLCGYDGCYRNRNSGEWEGVPWHK